MFSKNKNVLVQKVTINSSWYCNVRGKVAEKDEERLVQDQRRQAFHHRNLGIKNKKLLYQIERTQQFSN